MKASGARQRIVFTVALGCLLGLGCAKKERPEGEAGPGAATKRPPKRPACAQGLLLKVRLSESDGVTLTKPFELKKAIAWQSEARRDAGRAARLVHVAYANYEAALGADSLVPPRTPGQVAVVVSIKAADASGGPAANAPASVPTGAFPYGLGAPGQSYFVTVYLGGSSGGTVLSGQHPRGKAILTHSSADYLCGSFGLRSGSGSFLKGEFNLPVSRRPATAGAKP